MKILLIGSSAVLALTAFALAQQPAVPASPALHDDALRTTVVTADQKLAVRDAQHQLEKIVEQQDSITNQYLLLQQKMQSEAERLQKQHADAQAALDKVVAGIDCGKNAKFDEETEACAATPTPAAPTNANSQPKSSTPSPGAAAPPKIQEAKK